MAESLNLSEGPVLGEYLATWPWGPSGAVVHLGTISCDGGGCGGANVGDAEK